MNGKLLLVFALAATLAGQDPAACVLETSATIDGKEAGVLYASQGQVNLVLPFDAPESGAADLIITVGGVASEPFRVSFARSAPGVFTVLNADGTPNSAQRPAEIGEEVSLLVSGLGRPAAEADARSVSQDVTPWATEDLFLALSSDDEDESDSVVQPLWARSRAGELASIAEVRFRVPRGTRTGSGLLIRLPPGGFGLSALLNLNVTGGFDLYVRETAP